MLVKLPLTKQEMSALLLCIDVAYDSWETNPDEFEELNGYQLKEIDTSWLVKNHAHLVETIRALGGVR